MMLVNFIYGLAFVVMGMVLLFAPRRISKSDPFDQVWLIGMFGLLHGFNEWVEMFMSHMGIIHISLPILEVLAAVFLAGSFSFLALFGCRVLFQKTHRFGWLRHMWIAGFLAWALVLFFSKDLRIAAIVARYFICIPGTAMTALVLYRMIISFPREVKSAHSKLYYSSMLLPAAFVAYGFLGGFIVPKADFLFAGVINYDSFKGFVGIPVQVFRAICAVVIMCAVFPMTKLRVVGSLVVDRTRGGLLRKIIVSICSYVLLLVCFGVFLGYYNSFTIMRDTIGKDHETMAVTLARGIDETINSRIMSINGYANDPDLISAVKAKNAVYGNMSIEEESQYFSGMDAQWVKAVPESPLVKEYADNVVSRELLQVTRQEPGIAEIFIADARGGLVAASGKTSDYYQADETWWQKAYSGGKGAAFVGEMEYDQSSGMWSVVFAVPMVDDGSVVGVCKAVVNFDIFVAPLKKLTIGRTGEAALLDGKGALLYHKNSLPGKGEFLDKDTKALIDGNDHGWVITNAGQSNKQPEFFAWQKVMHPLLLQGGFSLFVVVFQEPWEAFQPLYALVSKGLLFLGILIVMTVFFGYVIGKSIVRPIKVLQEAAKNVAEGKLRNSIILATGDELEDLANTFNFMTESLQKTMVSRDSLAKEISQREQAEHAARLAEKDWGDSFDTISDAITIHDAEFNILRANKAAIDLLGLSLADVLRNKCFVSYHRIECPLQGCPSCNTLKTGKPSVAEVYEPRLGKFVEIKAMPRFDADQNVIGVVHIVRDITARHNAEEKLGLALQEEIKSREIMTSMLEDNTEIRGKLEKNLSELKQTQAMLVQSAKLASLGRLVSDMAHEVNNPLMIISGSAQLSLIEGGISDELKKNLTIIQEECVRAKNIIQRLLMFSRPSKGERKPVNINQSVEAVVSLLSHQFGLHNVRMLLQLAPGLPTVLADEKQLQEVMMNLLNNARDAIPGGGDITVCSALEGEYIKLAIKDSGAGMDTETMSHLFEPFFTTKEKGTGLGLSVCYGIVRAHNGILNISSHPGKGTTVSILLPIESGANNA